MSKLQLSLLLGIFFIFPSGLCAQFELPQDSTFYTLQDSFYHYYQDDSTEGGLYNKMRRATLQWGPRLAPDGRMSRANQAMLQYSRRYMNLSTTTGGGIQASTVPIVHPDPHPSAMDWGELGHLTPLIGANHPNAKGMGQIHRLAFHPSYNGGNNQIIYAGSHYGGLYRTDKGGSQWYNYYTDRGLPMTSVGDVVASANYVFVCTGNGDHASTRFGAQANYAPIRGNINDFSPIHTQGVYRNSHNNPSHRWVSINGNQVTMLDGTTASSLLEVFEQGGTIRRIVVHPSNEQLLLIATSQGVFRTMNGGNSWEQVLVGPANGTGGYIWETEWRGLEFHPSNPTIVYASAKDVYKSTDGGLTWASMTNNQGLQAGTRRTNITVTAAAPDRLYAYAVGWQGYVFLYENGSWTGKGMVSNHHTDWLDIAVSPLYADVVHLTGLFTYHNYDFDSPNSMFSNLNAGIIHDDTHYLGYPPNGDTILFAGTHGGVSKCVVSSVGKEPWTALYNGLGVATIYSFDDWEGNDSLIATANQDIGVNHTYNRGQTWRSDIRIGDGYSVRINDQTSNAYIKGNGYKGGYRLYPQLQEFYTRATEDFYEWNRKPRDSSYSVDIFMQPAAAVPNTFSAINHPKDETFYMGFSELYIRRNEQMPVADIPIERDTIDYWVRGAIYDSTWTFVRYRPSSGSCFPLPVLDLDTVYLPFRNRYRVDSLCRKIQTSTINKTSYPYFWKRASDIKQYHASTANRRILEVAFSEDAQTDYTYLVTLGDPGHRRCDLYFKDKNAVCDTCFIVKTGNLPIDNTIPSSITRDPNPVTGIAVDPMNGNRVWVTFSGYSKDLKVWYSEDAGDSWTNWDDSTNALAGLNVPINNIVYQRGTKDRLYIATDVGVYVREGTGKWFRYGDDFPNVRVTELKINYCVGKLRAATFGRGLWEVDLLPTESGTSHRSFRLLQGNETWTKDKHLSRSLRIPSGKSLHLQNMTLNMPKDGLIVIEQGAQLLVDSSTITNLCGQTWQGIEVWGNTSLEQHPNTNQGELILVNSQIAHAKEAVSPWQVGNFPRPDGTGGTGGIVRAINSTFYNNWRSVGFMQYQSPSGTYAEASNFIHCQFVVDSSLRQGFLGHVSAWDVANVRFKGCTFADNRPQKSGEAYGIYSLSASVQLTAQPPSPFHPNFKRNRFEGLARAIELGSDPTRFSSVVDQSDFDANGRGILVRADAGVKLIRNQFALGGYSNAPEYGIGLLRQGDFVVQQNTFTQSNQADAFDVSIGLWISDTKSGYNQVRNNSFVGIPIANLVHGDNGDDLNTLEGGLQYLCNGQTGNAFDLSLKQSSQLAVGTSIGRNQGEFLQPARNSFSYPLAGNYFADWHLWNDGSGMNEVIYWIPPNAVQVDEPTDTLNVENLQTIGLGDPNFCDAWYPNPYVFKPQEGNTTIPLSVLKSNYYQAESQYQNLASTASTQADSSEVAAIGQQVAYYANEVVFYYKNDTTNANWDSLTVWLGKIPGLMAQYDLVEHYWKQGLYTQAFNQLDDIQNNYELVGVVYENHRAYRSLKNILQTAYEENRNEALLDQEEVDQLRAIANNNYGFAAVYAANIVNFFYNYEYEYNPTLPTALQEKRNFVEEKPRTSNLMVYPNPSHTWAEVQYQLPKGQKEGLLRITSTNGQMLQEIPIYQSNGKLVLSTKEWTAGIYFVALYSEEELVEQTTLVVDN